MKALVLCALALSCCAKTPARRTDRGLVVLGIDGMDPKLTQRFMAAGLMPHARALPTFMTLATTDPPQSPVAWSTFITGMPPAGHGIFDFIHRDPTTHAPYLSTSKIVPGWSLPLGPWLLPVFDDRVVLLRRGEAFWDLLARAGVPSRLLHVPTCYPAEAERSVELLGGMGVPDLQGSYGTFLVLTTDSVLGVSKPSGGRVRMLARSGAHTFDGVVLGPPSPWHAEHPLLEAPMHIAVAGERAALIEIGDRQLLLGAGEWSDWVPLAFSGVHGMVRVLVASVAPELTIYVSPVNVDPKAAALPIASPPRFAADVAARIGRYHTLGIAEDSKALAAGVLDDAAFIEQAYAVLDERVAELSTSLSQFSGGLLFQYVSTLDQLSHAFFPEDLRVLEPHAAASDAAIIARAYQRIDDVIGLAVERAQRVGAAVLIVSDHGFGSFERAFSLNAWLAAQGELVTDGRGAVDMSKSAAYGLGFNQLFVQQPDALERISRALEAYRDPDNGRQVVSRVVAVAHPEPPAPDAIVNFAPGYRLSSRSALGEIDAWVTHSNDERWRGDHLTDSRDVPGVLLSTRAIGATSASLVDLAPTMLGYFNEHAPATMTGRDLRIDRQ